jgi:hypothetical protein
MLFCGTQTTPPRLPQSNCATTKLYCHWLTHLRGRSNTLPLLITTPLPSSEEIRGAAERRCSPHASLPATSFSTLDAPGGFVLDACARAPLRGYSGRPRQYRSAMRVDQRLSLRSVIWGAEFLKSYSARRQVRGRDVSTIRRGLMSGARLIESRR